MFGNDWDNVLKDIMDEKWFCDLIEEVKKEYKTKTIFPLEQNIFNAFIYTPFNSVKVVILGKILIMVKKRLMDFLFLLEKVLKCLLHLLIYLKN